MKPGSAVYVHPSFSLHQLSRFCLHSHREKTDQSASRLVISTSGIYVARSPFSVSAQSLFSASAQPFLFSFPSRKLVSLLQGWLFPYQMFTQLHRIFSESVPPFAFSFSSHKLASVLQGNFRIRRLWNNPLTLPSAFGLGCVTTLRLQQERQGCIKMLLCAAWLCGDCLQPC